jgi:serine/threonine protein kinase
MQSPGPYPCVQIADFGLARPQGYQETLNVCGTVSYLPPEGILALDNKHLGYVGMSADCWSAGVILFVMLSYVAVFFHLCGIAENLHGHCFCGITRGTHPFETELTPSCWPSSFVDSTALDYADSRCSQLSILCENKVKKRIVQGEITFVPNIWDAIPDGTYYIIPTISSAFLQNMFHFGPFY